MRASWVKPRVGTVVGLLAAASFGLSAPFSQRLVARCDPELLAGLLYAGAAVVLMVAGRGRRRHEAPLRRRDLPTLVAIMVFGGVVGPVLLLVGLERVTAVSGSLLLNLEAPFTAVLAVVVFGEHLGARGWLAGAAIVLGSAVLGGGAGSLGGDAWGVVLIAAACGAWAIDNNLTQRLTLKDPIAIVRFKAVGAAAINLGIAVVVRGAGWPAGWVVASALGLGAVSYGASILLDAYALRLLGAAREAALFATAPFAGAVVAIVVLGDPVTAGIAVAGVLMVGGTIGFLTDRHAHGHTHEPLAHEHRHTHDEHHQHEHAPGVAVSEPHSHRHAHMAVTHWHPHTSDVHHRHCH
jgi:drug/metabolite transporter (DMT)-like permease